MIIQLKCMISNAFTLTLSAPMAMGRLPPKPPQVRIMSLLIMNLKAQRCVVVLRVPHMRNTIRCGWQHRKLIKIVSTWNATVLQSCSKWVFNITHNSFKCTFAAESVVL